MKTVLAMILAASTSSVLAAEANVYNCKGKDIEITAVTSTQLQLILGNPIADVPTTNLSQTHLTTTDMGVTISGYYPFIADANLAYTLIVPRVVITAQSISGIKGMVVRTLTGGLFVPREPIPGPVEQNTYTPVVCTAHVSIAL